MKVGKLAGIAMGTVLAVVIASVAKQAVASDLLILITPRIEPSQQTTNEKVKLNGFGSFSVRDRSTSKRSRRTYQMRMKMRQMRRPNPSSRRGRARR